MKRRSLATGIACTAGGIGGIAFPLIVLYAAPTIGFPWAIRIIGFLNTVMCVLACLLLRKRLPHNKHAGAAIDLKALRDLKFGVTTVAVFLIEFAVFIPYTYISSYAIYAGLAQHKAYLLNTLLNVGAIPGRALPGYVADRFGPFNVMCITSAICSVFTLGLWLNSGTSKAAIMSFTILYGFWSGAAISLTPVCIGQVCQTEDYGKRSGTAFFVASFGALVGVPIAGAILQAGSGSYQGLILFDGCMYIAATGAFCTARIVSGGWGIKTVI